MIGRPPRPRREQREAPPVGARWVPIATGEQALVDEEDYDHVSRYNWVMVHGAATTWIGAGKINMHNMIMKTRTMIDHVNRNRLDNRKGNLRRATTSQNNANSKIRRNNKAGFKGVNLHKQSGLWRARITVERKEISLGYFETAAEAAHAYDNGARNFFGEFARVNFPNAGERSAHDA